MVINGEQAIRMPQKGNNILQFQNCHKQMSAPFVIYADFDPGYQRFFLACDEELRFVRNSRSL